jgi:hypothetical protein
VRIYCSGTAQIRHKTTGVLYSIESDELDWDAVGGDERQMGQEIRYEAVLDHPVLGHLRWSLWEYPVGIENYHETNVDGHEVVEDFDYGLEHEADPEPDDWVDYPLPDEPFTVFMNSYHQTGDLLADHGKDHGGYLLNRMVFSHHVTALEAYLGDTLLKAVLGDKVAMDRLMAADTDLRQEKFTLAEIAADTNLVEKKIREHLRSILYHNLAKVDFVYNTALQLKILNLISDKPSLFKAIKLRHDCVHRNGFDMDGKELTVFTKQFVQNTADLIKDFAAKIEAQVQARSRPS